MATGQPYGSELRDVAALCDLGRALALAGDGGRAIRLFQVACLRHPLDPAPWIGLGWSQQRAGRPRAAEVAYEVARTLGASHPALLVALAECRLRLGDPAAARSELEQAAAIAGRGGDEPALARVRGAIDHLLTGVRADLPDRRGST